MFNLLRKKNRSSAEPTLPLSSELFCAVHELEILANRRIAALMPGECRSAFRGSGMQFKEFRHYESGDDIRHMSWTVTARTGKPTIKVYDEERELDVLCLVDLSGSSLSGISAKCRRDMYAELVMLLGLAALRAGDKFGLLFFHDKVDLYLHSKRSKNQVLAGTARLLAQPLELRRSDLRSALKHVDTVLKNRSLIIVLSDFLLPPFEQELVRLCASHELILVHCFNDLERGHAPHAVFEARDPESGEFFLLDTHSRETRHALARAQLELMDNLQSLAHRNRASTLSLSLQDDYFKRLILFFRHRGASRL